ncbi:hypothetical protein Bbelb_239500 [Branchiostoma belcheri]|nr:hypothetical protein Bbelb_239500 [Branchiostoma belcheri]
MEMCAGGPYNSLRVVWGTYQYNRPPGRSVTLIEFGTLRANQTPAVKNLPGEPSPGGRGRASAAPKKSRPNHGRLDTSWISQDCPKNVVGFLSHDNCKTFKQVVTDLTPTADKDGIFRNKTAGFLRTVPRMLSVTLTPVTPGYTRRLPDYGLDMPGKGGDSTGWILHNRQLSHSMRPSCH